MKTLHAAPSVSSGGCIRFGDDGVYIHHNEAHTASGLRDVSIDDRGRLVISHAAPGPVITAVASPDETLVARGIALGCSGGVGTTIVVAAQDGNALDLSRSTDYAKIAGPYSNVWMFWLHDAS